ncbi:uncharacterized protein [Diabrotica undecimpunctata]|uniref:uncharacterized protein n=1 Tax=Diabrotica undecimpunctata TaxID=50387 RepID=UPI003B63A44F
MKLKYTSGIGILKNARVLKNADGKICHHEQECKEWERYISGFLDDASRENNTHTHISSNNLLNRGPSILKPEVRKAIQQAKNNKGPGPDQILAELIKLLDEENITYLTTFLSKIYNEEILLDDWLESPFITLSKKSRPPNAAILVHPSNVEYDRVVLSHLVF